MTSSSARLRSRLLALATVALAGTALTGCSVLNQITGSGGEEAVRDDSGEVIEGNENTDVFTIVPGDCLVDADASGEVTAVPTVPCDEPHDSEAYHAEDLPDGDYPGEESVTASADEICLGQFEAFVGAPYDAVPDVDFNYYYPTEASWAQGDREILCLVYKLDPEAGEVVQTTGTLEGYAG